MVTSLLFNMVCPKRPTLYVAFVIERLILGNGRNCQERIRTGMIMALSIKNIALDSKNLLSLTI